MISTRIRTIKTVLIVSWAVLAWANRGPVRAEPPQIPPQKQADQGSPIRITSDAVESDHRMQWLEFTGNVEATQEDVVITADRLKVFYKADSQASSAKTTVEKIVSQGNVRIVFDGKARTAEAKKAVYTARPKVLVLSGEGATLRSGKNTIQGEKITFFLAENRTIVERGEKRQVDATFYTEGNQSLVK